MRQLVYLSEVIVQNIFDEIQHPRPLPPNLGAWAWQAGIEFICHFSLFIKYLLG